MNTIESPIGTLNIIGLLSSRRINCKTKLILEFIDFKRTVQNTFKKKRSESNVYVRAHLHSGAPPIANLSSLEITPLAFLFASGSGSGTYNHCISIWIWYVWSTRVLASISAQGFFFRNFLVELNWSGCCQGTK